jgi:hypothetical protein
MKRDVPAILQVGQVSSLSSAISAEQKEDMLESPSY